MTIQLQKLREGVVLEKGMWFVPDYLASWEIITDKLAQA